MTVTNTDILAGPYNGNGVADTFDYEFKIDDQDELLVYETDSDGNESVLTVDVDYTVTGVGVDEGGTVVRMAGALASGYSWVIRSNIQPTQETAFESQGAFLPVVHENAIDKTTRLIQQLEEVTGRCLRLTPSVGASGIDTELPEPAAGQGVAWNNDGTGFINTGYDVATKWANRNITTDTTVAGLDRALVDTTGGQVTLTLPASPEDGTQIMIEDVAGNFASDYCIVARNGKEISQLSEDLTLDVSNLNVLLIYSSSLGSWSINYYTAGAQVSTLFDNHPSVANYTALRSLSSVSLGDDDTIILTGRSTVGDGGGGTFRWDSSDLSTEVTADTQSGIYVAPDDDNTGSSGAWVRQYSGALNAMWFGFSTVGDNTTAFAAVVAAAVAFPVESRPVIELPKGRFQYSASPNMGHSGLTIIGPGPDACVLEYTGTGVAFNIDPSAFDTSFRYGVNLSGFLLDAGPSATSGFYVENLAHSVWQNVFAINGAAGVCIHFNFNLLVLCRLDTIGSPLSRWTVSSAPVESIRLAASPSKGSASTANTFINPIAEGATGGGIRLLDADNNTFVGGSSESNSGRGVLVNTTCRNNTFDQLDMESNTVEDFNDAGQGTIFKNCLATSPSGSDVSASSVLSKVQGGYYENLKVSAGAVGAHVADVNVNVNGSGGFTDAGIDTTMRNIYDKTAGSFLFANLKGSRAGITVGASPFTYTNTSSQLQNVLVRGGTVSLVTWGRGGDTVPFGGGAEGANVNGQFLLAPGDTLQVTYSVSPVMNAIPMGVQNI